MGTCPRWGQEKTLTKNRTFRDLQVVRGSPTTETDGLCEAQVVALWEICGRKPRSYDIVPLLNYLNQASVRRGDSYLLQTVSILQTTSAGQGTSGRTIDAGRSTGFRDRKGLLTAVSANYVTWRR